ncbi:MAG: hypothetical protein WC766_04360 [Patescibacteria group bacterium]|jgi:hypothetical protein
MLKSKSIIPHDRPVYREVLPQALKTAWRNPLLWIFGIFAAVLNSGGALDACWKFFNSIQTQGSDIFIGQTVVQIWHVGWIGGFHLLPFFQALLAIFSLTVIFLAVLAFSCIGQGVIIQSVGSGKDGSLGRIKKAMLVSGRALLPIAVLNVIIIAAIWLTRFLVSLPLAMVLGRDSGLRLAIYLVSFIVFFVLAFFLSILQIYALNAMMSQGATLAQAFGRAWQVIKQHWLVTIETAILQALIIVVATIAALIALMILIFPPAVLYVLALFRQNFALFQLSSGIFAVIIVVFLVAYTGFTVTFQYALWTHMYRKFGEGGVMPKLHRLFRFAAHKTDVPQS